MQELVRMENICGSNILAHARLNVLRGEIVGLLGMNNAGKSELMDILTGQHRPEKGTVYFEDHPVFFTSPSQANELGICYIHGEQELLKEFTVTENIFVMRRKHDGQLLNMKQLSVRCSQLLGVLFSEETGISFQAEDRLRDLNGLQRLAVQIIKTISENAKLMVIDHYIDDFPHHWVTSLRKWLALLARNLNISFIVTDHKAHNLSELCDRIFVLRSGMSVGTFSKKEYDEKILTSVMTGSLMEDREYYWRPSPGEEKILEFSGLRVPGEKNKLNIELIANEMVGLCCMSHHFVKNLCDALIGEVPIQKGEILLEGTPIEINSPEDITKYGIGIVFAKARLFPNMNFEENVSITALRKFSTKAGIVNNSASTLAASEALSIWKPPHLLSGGNQIDRYTEKKILISRAMAILPQVMIYQNLDKGLDDVAYDRLVREIWGTPIRPKASLFISSNVRNLIKVCTKIYFIYEGQVINKVYPAQTAEEAMLSYYKTFCEM